MTIEVNSHRLLSKILQSSANLAEIYKRVYDYCRGCKTPSPMICVEQCELWRVKNEVLKLSAIVNESDHLSNLFNAIKNDRRLKIMDMLSQQPCSTKELQEYLKIHGYYHSRRTISEYINPLLRAGLVKKESDRFRSTFYGRKIYEVLGKHGFNNLLPIHSRCYEEIILKELANGPKTQDELLELVPLKSLPRAIRRLREKGVVAKNKPSDYVFYFKIENQGRNAFSPTEKRVIDAIPDVGISARKLSREIGITLRRTYKYLRKLREKKLIFAKRMPITYELSTEGKRNANLLEVITQLALAALDASNFMLRRHPNIAAMSNNRAP